MSLVKRDNLSRVFWEPYIFTGYRQTDTTFIQCLKYIFVLHNDWGNFWTHFIPFIAWICWLYKLSFKLDFTSAYWWPLLMLWAGGCSYAFCSSMAHCFGCKSLKARQICFMIDYHGISMYAFGGGVAYYFYERPLDVELFSYTSLFITMYMLISLSATLICSLSRFFWEEYRYFLRAGAYVLPYMAECFPFFSRLSFCISNGNDCLTETLPYHFTAFFISHLMAFFFVSKLPERLLPGKFDIFFHSHQLFHIAAALVTSIQFYMIPYDASVRRSSLMGDQVVANIYNTLVPFLAVLTIGFGMVAVFGYLVMKGTLVSNKVKSD